MTYGEIVDYILAYRNRELRRQKEQASNIYTLASLIKIGISSLVDETAHYPSINELYPDIFDEELKRIEELAAEREMEIWKQRMINFAQDHNKNRKRGDSN